MVRLCLAAPALLLLATPAAADPWVYLGNYADSDGTNPWLIDKGSIATRDGVTSATVRVNVAFPWSEGLVIAEYGAEMDCKARTFRYKGYRYLDAKGAEKVAERFLDKLTPLPDKAYSKRVFAYACGTDTKGTSVGAYDHAAIRKKWGGTAPEKK